MGGKVNMGPGLPLALQALQSALLTVQWHLAFGITTFRHSWIQDQRPGTPGQGHYLLWPQKPRPRGLTFPYGQEP